MRLLTAEQMRAADACASSRVGAVELMRRAGVALAEGTSRIAPRARRIVAFAGPGNNGGDAFATFAELDRSCERVVYASAAPHVTEARAEAEARARAAGVVARPLPADAPALNEATAGADLLVDALLGTGARSEPSRELALAVDALNAAPAPVLAVDIPTGIDASSGAAAATTVRAATTITLGAAKIGLVLDPARAFAGTIYLGDIGILPEEIESVGGDRYAALDDNEFLALLPKREVGADKRSAGAPLVVAGSKQFPGAAVLCALGAARAGAGYVTVATPEDVALVLRSHLVEQVVMTFRDDAVAGSIDELLDLTNHSSAVAIGPGLGLSDALGDIVRGFVEKLGLPFVADASAFFHFAKHLDILRGKRCVITPHEREFARLSGQGTISPGTRVARLRSFVTRSGVTTLLKGHATLIDDGTTLHVNLSGTPALATAGTGDVLSGIIGTLLSQGLAPVDAARAGAYWHGLAGRYAARARGVGVIARDVADALGPSLPAPSSATTALRVIAEP
jgi:ADP-dependent NAD(P)H-hydrate dehydratase / NAD(P)H-hydrate epimerase